MQVLGLSEPPIAGDELRVTDDTAVARTVGEAREQRLRLGSFASASASSSTAPGAKLEDLFEQISRGETAMLNLVLKADVQGSLEAVTESLRKLERDEVKISFVHRAVGGITESDVDLAAASGASIIGFNVRPDRRGRELAEQRHVEIRTYEIIYKLIEDIQAAMVGMLAPEIEEVVTGDAEVRTIFRVPRIGADRRLLRAQRRHHPWLEGPVPPGRARSSGRARSRPSSASRTTSARCRPATSAASA